MALFFLSFIENSKSEVWNKKQRMGVNKINSFMKNMTLEAELNVDGRQVINHLENACEELIQGFLSAKKCYHRCKRPHKWALTGRLFGNNTASNI